MSFWGGGGSGNDSSAAATEKQNLKKAEIEVKTYADLFTKMCGTCFEKCVSRYSDTDLNLGEMSCVDRCAAKYLESHGKVGEVMSKFEEQLKEQMAAQQGVTGSQPPG